MADSDYAIEPYWWSQDIPEGIGGARSWTLHIINRGKPFDLATASMSIVFTDGTSYSLDLLKFVPSMFNHNSQIDFQTLPSMPQWSRGVHTEIHCEIRGKNPGTLQTNIIWK